MLHTRDIDSLDFTMIGGVSYHKKWGTLSLEWDGSNINFGSRFLVNNSFIFRNGITRNISDSSELIFRSSFGVIDIFEPIVSNDQTVIIHNDEKTESSQVEVSAGLEHLQKGVEYYYNGQYREALKSYQLAAQFFKRSAIIHERLGSLYYKLGEYHDALLEWQRAYALEPNDHLNVFITDLKKKTV